MSEKQIRTCNVCGKEIEYWTIYWHAELDTDSIYPILLPKSKDICGDCMKRIEDIVKNGRKDEK